MDRVVIICAGQGNGRAKQIGDYYRKKRWTVIEKGNIFGAINLLKDRSPQILIDAIFIFDVDNPLEFSPLQTLRDWFGFTLPVIFFSRSVTHSGTVEVSPCNTWAYPASQPIADSFLDKLTRETFTLPHNL